jgi:uncharacterized OsmC-like protein
MKQTHVAAALERNAKAVTLQPSRGQKTAITTATLRDGLACDIREGPWHYVAAMSEKYGGSQEGPTPGLFGRGAMASCLALGYAMWAARLDIQIDSLEVEVHADYDVRGELGVADEVRPGYLEIRYIVNVSSPARPEEIERWLDTADRYSSWRDNIANAVPLVCERRINLASTEPR